MKYTVLVLVSIFLASCTSDAPSPKEVNKLSPSASSTKKQSPVVLLDNSLFGEWVYEKVPDSKGASSEDQVASKELLGDTKLTLTKDDYTIFMMGSLDTGTYKRLDTDTYEWKSASEHTQKVGLKKINDNQLIFTFLGDKEIQMKKSEQ